MGFISFFLLLFFSTSQASFSQDLLQERIWKISSRKRSIFFDKGIFRSDLNSTLQELRGIRNSYIVARGFERIVFDFSSKKPPQVYGKISKKEQKVYLDFFNTNLAMKANQLKNIKFLKNIDFFTLEKDKLSLELTFNKKVSFDIFYLENPTRIVLDIKE